MNDKELKKMTAEEIEALYEPKTEPFFGVMAIYPVWY